MTTSSGQSGPSGPGRAHKWKHVRGDGASSLVTVLVDLTPVVDGTGPSRLLDMVPGRWAKVLIEWLDARDQALGDRVTVVTMDGFVGYHSTAAKAVPAAPTVMDPFHVVHPTADKLTVCRQRVQQATTGCRGRTGDQLYSIRRTLNTRAVFLTDRQKARLWKALTANDADAAVEVTYSVYQRLIAAYGDSSKREGKLAMFKLLKAIKGGVPKGVARTGSARPLAVAAPRGDPGLLRHRGVQRPRPGPSTDASSTCAESPSVSATSTIFVLRSLIHFGGLQNRINEL